MAKDINIHVKAPGADQAKQQLDKVGQSAKGVGEKAAKGGEAGAKGLSRMDKVLKSVKASALGFIGAFLGMATITKIINSLVEKLEKVQRLQKSIYEKSLSMMQGGQALELQTGTVGKQQEWAKIISSVQKAGGLATPGAATQLLTSADISFAERGGIKNEEIIKLVKGIAPYIGAAGLSSDETSGLLKMGAAAGTKPTAEAYLDFFAKTKAAYTSSASTEMGRFVGGAQKGVTSYLAQGGSLETGLSLYSGAIGVSPSEELAGTDVERLGRIASGQYPKFRKMLEKKGQWPESIDERMAMILQHAKSIPISERAQTLQEQGLPGELTGVLGRIVSPKAMEYMSTTAGKVTATGAFAIRPQMAAYKESVLGKHFIAEAGRDTLTTETGPQFASWQERLETAKTKFDIRAGKGEEKFWTKDEIEVIQLALESLKEDVEKFEPSTEAEGEKKQQLQSFLEAGSETEGIISHLPGAAGELTRGGYEATKAFEKLSTSTPEIHYHNDIISVPVIDPGSMGFDRTKPGVQP